jgi:DNA-binding NarL/FixJ family response regulator
MDLPNPTTRIAIQDRQRLFRDGLTVLLAGELDFSVEVTAATAAEFVVAVTKHRIDLVVLELDAPEWDACRLVAGLRKANPNLRVLGTVAGDTATLSPRAYQAGVRSVFPRNAGMERLISTLRSVPSPSRALPVDKVIRLDERRSLLSGRELEVLGEIGAGSTTRDVAAVMGISPKTVENHKQRIFSKLGVQNQAHAVAVAMRQGLLTPWSGPTLLPTA